MFDTGVIQELRAELGGILREEIDKLSLPRLMDAEVAAVYMGTTGVALILDIEGMDSQAARTGLRSGRSVRAIAGPHRSLRARARSWMMC